MEYDPDDVVYDECGLPIAAAPKVAPSQQSKAADADIPHPPAAVVE